MRFEWGSATDVGRVRTNNQDSSYSSPDVFAVADGMGGHQGGEVASSVALDVLVGHYGEHTLDGLREAAEHANDAVYQQAANDPDLRGMGTTLVAIAPVDDDQLGRPSLAWINIGDSRLYRFRDGELEQITEDHSLVEEMVRDGRISRDEARRHPQRNILTRALGIDVAARIDQGTIDPFAGDRYLLCSDGLFNEVDEDRIASTLRRLGNPEDAAHELVRQALEGGGRDNITVVLVDVVDDDGASARASATVAGGTAEGHATEAIAGEGAAGRPDAATKATKASPSAKASGRKPRRVTFRVLLFAVILVALVGVAYYAVYHQARDGYTVKLVGENVVVYRGNGESVLWLKPSIASQEAIAVAPADQQHLQNGVHLSSQPAVQAYLQTLKADAAAVTTTTTTTTTTTVPATTTTVPASVPAN